MDYAEIILDMQLKIINLEREIDQIKKKLQASCNGRAVSFRQGSTGQRDTTRYLFEGAVYPKNRLVLAVVKAYVRDHGLLTKGEVKQTFERSLQGSIGVVEEVEIARLRSDYKVRFFTKETEILHLIDGDLYICTQWGILNLPKFLKRAEQLGFSIEAI